MKAFRLTTLFLIMTFAGSSAVLYYIYLIILDREIHRAELEIRNKASDIARHISSGDSGVSDSFSSYNMSIGDMPTFLILLDKSNNIEYRSGLSLEKALNIAEDFGKNHYSKGISKKNESAILFYDLPEKPGSPVIVYGLEKEHIYNSISYIPFKISVLIFGISAFFVSVFYIVIYLFVENPLRISVEDRLGKAIQRIALRNDQLGKSENTNIPNGFLSAGLRRVLNYTMYLLEHWAVSKRIFEDFSNIALLEKEKESIFRILFSMTRSVNHIERMIILEKNSSVDRLEMVFTSSGSVSEEIIEHPSKCLAFRCGNFFKQDQSNPLCPSCICNTDQMVLCYPLIGGAEVIGVAQFILNMTSLKSELETRTFTVEDKLILIEKDIGELVRIAGSAASGLNMIEIYRNQAVTDTLTGLYNRRYIVEYLSNTINVAKRKADDLCMLLVDIDFFKRFNDEYGHKTGDRVLKAVAETMRRSVREGDVIGRYGGEEFIIILPQTNAETAHEIAERLREDVSIIDYGQFELHNIPKITISIGIAQFPVHGYSHYHLTAAADKALYEAKNSGRNRVHIHTKIPEEN